MSIDQFAALAGGLACLAVSIKAIANREIAMHLDDEDEPGLWLYGWRAVAVGLRERRCTASRSSGVRHRGRGTADTRARHRSRWVASAPQPQMNTEMGVGASAAPK